VGEVGLANYVVANCYCSEFCEGGSICLRASGLCVILPTK
jgi:hypothetical protein